MTVLLAGASSVWALIRRPDPEPPQSDFAGELLDLQFPHDRLEWWPSKGLVGTDYPMASTRSRPFLDVPGGGCCSRYRIIGYTQDSTGSPLGGVEIDAYLTAANAAGGKLADAWIGSQVSDAGGYYEFWTSYPQAHYLAMRLPGTPTRTGMTDNNVIPAAP